MKLKAQAAMEYLMTYGWAILIVIVVVAALYWMGPLNPATWVRPTATGFGTIGVPEAGTWSLTTGGRFILTLTNHAGNRINITSVRVVPDTGSCPTVLFPELNRIYEVRERFNITADCTGTPTRSGSPYRIDVEINFIFAIPGGAAATDSGTVSGKVV